MEQCVYYNGGKTDKIVFVFSCPGQKELNKGRPVTGDTGKNLEKLLNELEEDFLKKVLYESTFMQWKEFDSEDKRYFFRITNTTEEVLFYAQNKKTEEKNKSVIELNLERLYSQVKNADWIFCFGKNAEYAINSLKENGYLSNSKILKTIHLSMRNLNVQIQKDINGLVIKKGEEKNTEKRIQVVAQELIDQYNQSK